MTTRQIIIDNLLTTYVESGSGEPVLLLHGWGDTKETFTKLQQELQSKYHVLALDLPGFGKTEAPKQAWSLADYAQFVQHFLTKVGVGPLRSIIGHSNGGAIAIVATSQGLIEVEKIVLLASAGIRNTRGVRKGLVRLAAMPLKVSLYVLPTHKRTKVKRKLYQKLGSDLYVAEHMQETFKKIVAEDVSQAAAKLTQPVLLIYGTADRATPVNFGERLKAQIPDSRLEVFQDGSHFLHQENADEVNRLVQEFIK